MRRRIWNVVRMEWTGIAATPSSPLFLVAIPPLLVGQALFLAWIVPRFVSPAILGTAGGDADTLRLLILRHFPFIVLLIPAMVANVFATLGIVEEKVSRTLEPLLATPISTIELLAGKSLAALLPAVAATYAGFGLYAVGAWFMISNPAAYAALLDARWLLAP